MGLSIISIIQPYPTWQCLVQINHLQYNHMKFKPIKTFGMPRQYNTFKWPQLKFFHAHTSLIGIVVITSSTYKQLSQRNYHCTIKAWNSVIITYVNYHIDQIFTWLVELLESRAPRCLGYWFPSPMFLPSICVSPFIWPLELALSAPLTSKSWAKFLPFWKCNNFCSIIWNKLVSSTKVCHLIYFL